MILSQDTCLFLFSASTHGGWGGNSRPNYFGLSLESTSAFTMRRFFVTSSYLDKVLGLERLSLIEIRCKSEPLHCDGE